MTTARDIFRSPAFRVGAMQSALWVGVGGGLMHLVSSFEKIFKDFGCHLPDMTIAVINLSYFLVNFWYLGLLAVLLWPFAYWGVAQLLSPRRGDCPDFCVSRAPTEGWSGTVPFDAGTTSPDTEFRTVLRRIAQGLWCLATWTFPFACSAFVLFALYRPLIVLIDKLQH
jgi:hypothetical protein